MRAGGFVIRDIALRADGAPFGLHLNGRAASLTARNVVVSGYDMGVLVTDARFDVEGAVVEGNQTGFYLTGAEGRIANSTVVNNLRAGIVTRSGVRATIEHNTIVGNAFAGTGEAAGGLALGPGGVETVRNNIVVGNNEGVRCSGCSSPLRRNDVWGNVTGCGGNVRRGPDDLSVDPRFVEPAERDFRLRAGSPCVDAGLAGGPAADAAGAPRPAGAGPDLGAFEHQPPTARVVVNEVMANPLDEATGEFVELYNAGGAPVDLAGYLLDDGDAVDVIRAFGDGPTVVAPGGFAVVLDRDVGDDLAMPAGTVRLTVPDARLGNALAVGDPVILRAPDGNTVVSACEAPFDPGNGVSAERLGDRFVPSPCGASPGARNCAEAPPEPAAALLVTEVMANPLDEGTGEFVEILNLAEGPIDLAGTCCPTGRRPAAGAVAAHHRGDGQPGRRGHRRIRRDPEHGRGAGRRGGPAAVRRRRRRRAARVRAGRLDDRPGGRPRGGARPRVPRRVSAAGARRAAAPGRHDDRVRPGDERSGGDPRARRRGDRRLRRPLQPRQRALRRAGAGRPLGPLAVLPLAGLGQQRRPAVAHRPALLPRRGRLPARPALHRRARRRGRRPLRRSRPAPRRGRGLRRPRRLRRRPRLRRAHGVPRRRLLRRRVPPRHLLVDPAPGRARRRGGRRHRHAARPRPGDGARRRPGAARPRPPGARGAAGGPREPDGGQRRPVRRAARPARAAAPAAHRGAGIARDEAVNGVWTLRVVDRAGGGIGLLHAWVLDIVGNWD